MWHIAARPCERPLKFMTAALFSAVFLTALILTTLAKFWLGVRHLRHIALNRDSVPSAFSEKITLEAH